jgi:hypothetical protein
MESMRCLAIGVSDAPPLEFLQGAANGAKALGRWACDQGIPTEVLTDDEDPIGFAEIRAAFERLFVGRPRISRLLIYFAGHGLSRGAGEDLWLLSEWSDQQRAIAVSGLRRRLERFGVDQITIVADACRSLPNSTETADLAADPVLGKGPFEPKIPLIDCVRRHLFTLLIWYRGKNQKRTGAFSVGCSAKYSRAYTTMPLSNRIRFA